MSCGRLPGAATGGKDGSPDAHDARPLRALVLTQGRGRYF